MTADPTSTEPVPSTEGEADSGSSSAPYMAFGGFRNLIDRLKRDGVPQVFDQSFFGRQSGSLTAQTRATLRYFDLIDEERKPTPVLHALVDADEARRVSMLREMAESRYADAIALGRKNGTQGQLQDVFRGRGLAGNTVLKAVAFYLGLAEYVGLPLSPFFKKQRIPSTNGGARKTTRKRTASNTAATPAVQTVVTPVDAVEAKRVAYVEMLMKLAEASAERGDVQDGLLDRIERALGYTSPTDKEATQDAS